MLMYWIVWAAMMLLLLGPKATAFAVFVGLCGGGCWWCGRAL
jgi:hypothetical protein